MKIWEIQVDAGQLLGIIQLIDCLGEIMNLITLLRDEIKNSGLSCYQICKETGIDKAAMSRFVNGQQGLTLDYAYRLLNFFGYKIKKTRKTKKGQVKK